MKPVLSENGDDEKKTETQDNEIGKKALEWN